MKLFISIFIKTGVTYRNCCG